MARPCRAQAFYRFWGGNCGVQVSALIGENGHAAMVRWMALLLALGNLKLNQ